MKRIPGCGVLGAGSDGLTATLSFNNGDFLKADKKKNQLEKCTQIMLHSSMTLSVYTKHYSNQLLLGLINKL